jgi:type IV pilus assembly protein PilY1
MNRLLSILALTLLAGVAQGAVTSIAQLPLLNMNGTGAVRPNLMLLYDNSGSMNWMYTPDYVNDRNNPTTCRSGALMSSARPHGCMAGEPPFNSADFNRQYYDPKVQYSPPVRADGSSYPSLDRTTTKDWTAVTTDGYGVNGFDMQVDARGNNNWVATSNLATGFLDLRWCDSNGANCGYNTATYTYPDNTRKYSQSYNSNPYYYTINVAEYCTDASLTNCQGTTVGAAAPAGYPNAAKVRWCDSTALTNCQAKYVGNFVYPRFASPNGGVLAAFGTITIGASAGSNPVTIDSVSVTEPAGAVVITNGVVTAAKGTNLISKQTAMATDLAASIIAKTGLANQYTACVRTPGTSSVPACSTFGITLGADNIVAVIPIDCVAGATSKAIGPCSVVPDNSRDGWALSASAPLSPVQPATALITFSGTTGSNNIEELSGITLGTRNLLASVIQFSKSAGATAIASQVVTAINASTTRGTVTAYVGGNPISSACSGVGDTSVCLVNTASNAANQAVTMGSLTNNTTKSGVRVSWTTANSTSVTVSDAVQVAATPLGAGAAVFVRTDIVSANNSYPKGPARSDCAGATCTYDEEMTNFANWYGYYKTRNQMMKTAVGHAFQPITSNYNVGIVSLSVASAEGAMTLPPKEFKGTDRSAWYTELYRMSTSGSTPMRQALHAVGKMYANQSPYVAAAGAEVVRYPCQQNFTFVTTDGYWNGSAAASVTNNDNVENRGRFCTRASGCVDPSAQTANSLADVALYWYNGGSNNTVTSLRPSLEDWTAGTGVVPAATGDNTRLHMNTYALGLGVDGIMTYEANYDSTPVPGGDFYKLVTGATSGCPWNNKGAYVWPDPVTSDTNGGAAYQSRVDDLWHAAINGHGKYFSAADPQQVVEGLRSALSNIEVRVGAAAAAATSTPNISLQDNDIFSDTFTTVKWYGELSDKKLDPATGIVSSTMVWNSSDMVGRKVAGATDTRRILMLDTVNGGLKAFKYDVMTTAEQAWFRNKCNLLAQCPSLSASDLAIVNDGATLVNWLRGQQQYANDTLLRAYSRTDHNPAGLSAPLPIVLGDIASSKPAYLRDPRKNYTATGYNDFKVTYANRRASVFVAANDGMLHAFNAADTDSTYQKGEEMWAYAPRITMSKLAVQASTTYGTNHQFTTDGSPEVADVKIGTNWKTVLVAGLNGGGRGYYALDVTDPANPVALWELCADPAICSGINNEPELGLSFGNPQFGTWKDSGGVEHWVVFLTSGYNNVPGTDGVAGGSGKGYLFVVDVATGQVLARTSTGAGDTTTPSGLAKITAISANPLTDPLVTYVYGGDNQGQMWRFDLTAGGNPVLAKMGDAGSSQPVTTRPDVTQCGVDSTDAQGVVSTAAQTVVVFGTGRLLDVPDIADTGVQSAYVLKDSSSGIGAAQWRNAANMARQKLVKTKSAAGDTYTISGAAIDLSTQAGWYVDFDQNVGERVNLDPKIVAGGLNVVTNIPTSSSSCQIGGTSNVYQLNVCTGRALVVENGLNAIAGRTLSNNSAAVGFIVVRLPSGALKMVTTTADGNTITSGVQPATTLGARKAGWRRVRN